MKLDLASFVSILLFMTIATTETFADTIVLVNQDRISGRLVSMEEGTLIIETPYAGEITLDWGQVARVVTDETVQVVLNDQTSLSGNPQEAEPGKMELAMGKTAETVSFDLDDVQAINPKSVDEPAVKFRGRANVGLSKSSGNTETESHHVDGEIVARTKTNRYTAGIEYNREENDDQVTEEEYIGYAKYDHFFNDKWYSYLNTLFEKNEFKDLNLRSTVGAGMGYQFYESELTNLSLEAGLGYVNEDFIDASDEDSGAGRWAVNFDRYVYQKYIQLFHFHEGYQSLQESEELFIRSRTGLRFPLNPAFQATLQYDYDYDNNPSPGEEKDDSRYLFTLGYTFN
ncbi:MAG: DUF481 domain-containing protein [Desulfocapsaceae bacterium]|nr:DUF481 domain-containing protein [Desulfocapsaceae bacterium]